MNIEITLNLNEEDITDLLSDESNKNTCTASDMLAANEDELNWYKAFLSKHADLFRNTTNQTAILARADLVKRIRLGEKIVEGLRGKK